MVLTLEEQRRRAERMPMLTLTERIYVDDDGKATTDPEKGVRLWGTPGLRVSEVDALAIGYVAPQEEEAPQEEAPKPKAVRRPKGTKMVERPGGDK
jgi:hypothetical protein